MIYNFVEMYILVSNRQEKIGLFRGDDDDWLGIER